MKNGSTARCMFSVVLGMGIAVGSAGPASATMKCNQIDIVEDNYEYKNCRKNPVEITVRWSDPLGVAPRAQTYQFGMSEWKVIYQRSPEEKRNGRVITGKITSTKDL